MKHFHGRGSAGIVPTRYVDLPGELPLDCGRSLSNVGIAYEMYGDLSTARDNVVLVCHALSGDAHAAGWSAEGDAPSAVDGMVAEERGISARSGLGWWDGFIGPGKAFDTDRYCVICTNTIASCRGSTGPASINPATGQPYGPDFPVITVSDMVRAQAMFLDSLEIPTLLAAVGGSLGGMQALEWTVAYPDRIRGCITTASTAHLDSRGVAWNAIARNAIMADPDWQGGAYYGTGREPLAGIGIARMVGHVTYLSDISMDAKFDRRLQNRDCYSYTLDHHDFQVESYLRHQAETFSRRFDANSYLYLSRALTYFDLARTHGHGSLARALSQVEAQYLLISFSSDWLYPTKDSLEILEALQSGGKTARHQEIPATYGHDSFLLEEEKQKPLIESFLQNLYSAEQRSTSDHADCRAG
jgi:homoserine O-acetyltransferase/O-succinyltransferase